MCFRRVALIIGSLGLMLGMVAAQNQEPAAPPEGLPKNPADLVRAAVENELKPVAHQYFMYRLLNTKPDGTQTKENIETSDGVIGRLIAIDGKPLTPDQRAKEDQRLQKLVDDPSSWQAKQKSQREDDQRTRSMVHALPDAFLYQYDGTEQTPYGEVVKLSFTPNPDFDPPSRETLVYRGMRGHMKVNLKANRLQEIDAGLFRDVNFGWGILGHLDTGGKFMVQQGPVSGDHWETTHMVLNFTGKALLFKTIKIHQDETTSDYHPVDNMTLVQALNTLKKIDGEVAENTSKSAK